MMEIPVVNVLGIAVCSGLIGWKLTAKGKDAAPAMADVYAEIREAWHRYIKKLCKVTT